MFVTNWISPTKIQKISEITNFFRHYFLSRTEVSVAFADNFMVDSVTITMINDFTPIEVKDLPAAVQEAITKNYAESTIKEAAVEANEDGTKTYKVVLTDKEGTESTVLFSESGEVLK